MMSDSQAPASAKDSEYKIKFKSPGWNLKEDKRSDYVWINQLDGRILLSNSFCQEFQDQPLDKLATKTFQTIDDVKYEKQGYKTFHDREAYELKGTGKVDGVPVSLKLMNTRRNNCYFDFVSITPLDSAQEDQSDFTQFLDAVEFK